VKEKQAMMKNLMRGILGLVLTAAATWLANYIVDQVFGPDEEIA
jgi:hypothetical protein